MKEKLKEYIANNLEQICYSAVFLDDLDGKEIGSTINNLEEKDNVIDRKRAVLSYKQDDLDKFIKNEKDENIFQKLLFEFIDSKELKDSDVYNKVHLDRRLFSKIRSDKNYHPSKETVLLLGIALELKEEEIEKLLKSASYSLPRNNIYDLIIRFCFVEGIYNIDKINELLDSYQCKLFSY